MASISARAEATAGAALLTLEGVSKSYGGRTVLRDVSLTARAGRVLGLAGENGAGKSTLLKVAAGIESPDRGRLAIRGEEVRLGGYHDALERGVSMVFQEQALLSNLPVYENLLLGMSHRFTSGGVVRHGRMRRRAGEVVESFGLAATVDLDAELGSCDFGVRQLVEIMRAFAVAEIIGIDRPVVLLDEATAALNDEERDVLFGVVRRVRDRAAMVFVSHLLSEVLALCDEVLVLKDGAMVEQRATARTTSDRLHQMITGREVPESLYLEDRQRTTYGPTALRVVGLGRDGAFERISFEARAGEVVGIAGVVGSGKESLGRCIVGLDGPDQGSVEVVGDGGVGYVPKERKEDGIILEHSVLWNASIAGLVRGVFRRAGLLDLRRERRWADRMIRELDVRPADADMPIGLLSGGNQQKVVLGRWTLVSPTVLVLDNPTRGVDVGSRHAIYGLIRRLCDEGMCIVLISDDLLEVIGMSNRVLAMRDRRLVTGVDAPHGAKPSEEELVASLV